MTRTFLHAAAAVAAMTAGAVAGDTTGKKPGYAEINGLKMYYEIHGDGPPLVLLHGGMGTIEGCFKPMLPKLAKRHRVIAVEQQGHGRTADIDRPLSYEQMADDTAALLKHLKVEKADLLGWSDGASVALEMAIRHPAKVGKMVLIGTCFDRDDAYEPELIEFMKTMSPEALGPVPKAEYAKVAPNPDAWPALIAKLKVLWLESKPIPAKALRAISSPALVVSGDRGGDRPEHATKLYRLLPNAKLSVLPGASHFAPLECPTEIAKMALEFLDSSEAPAVAGSASQSGPQAK